MMRRICHYINTISVFTVPQLHATPSNNSKSMQFSDEKLYPRVFEYPKLFYFRLDTSRTFLVTTYPREGETKNCVRVK